MDEPAPPVPAGWAGRRFRLAVRLSLMFLPLVALGAAAAAFSAFVANQPGQGVFFAAGAILGAHVVGVGWSATRVKRRTSPAPTITSTPDGDGVRFGYSFWPYYWLTVVLVLTGLFMVVAAVAAGATVAALLPLGLAALIGWFLGTMLCLAPGYLIATPAGVLHRGLTFVHFVPWDVVVGVTTDWFNGPFIVVHAVSSPAARVRHYMGRFHTGERSFLPWMVIRAVWLAGDPAIVYRTLAFYHARPELRPELATTTALHRIASGEVVLEGGPA